MTEYPSNRKPLSPAERLENIDDALFENELLDESESDAADAERAATVIRLAIAQARAASAPPAPEPVTQMPWGWGDPWQDLDWLEGTEGEMGETASNRRREPTPSRDVSVLPPRPIIQKLGFHPAIAFLLVGFNLMHTVWHVPTISKLGNMTILPFALIAGGVTLILQRKWYGDHKKAAFIKGMVATALSAFPFAPLVLIPVGLMGFFRRKRARLR